MTKKIPMSFLQRRPQKAADKKENLQNPKILEVNLIKDEARVVFDWNKNLSLLFLVLFIAALLVVEVYIGLNWWEKEESANSQTLDTNVATVVREIAAIKNQADNALTYKTKSVLVNDLLNNHVYWTNFFNWLEKNTLSTVKYDGFNGDLSGNYSLAATAATYSQASWQVKAFLDDPLTRSVDVSTVSAGSGISRDAGPGVNFSLLLQVNPEIFKTKP